MENVRLMVSSFVEFIAFVEASYLLKCERDVFGYLGKRYVLGRLLESFRHNLEVWRQLLTSPSCLFQHCINMTMRFSWKCLFVSLTCIQKVKAFAWSALTGCKSLGTQLVSVELVAKFLQGLTNGTHSGKTLLIFRRNSTISSLVFFLHLKLSLW